MRTRALLRPPAWRIGRWVLTLGGLYALAVGINQLLSLAGHRGPLYQRADDGEHPGGGSVHRGLVPPCETVGARNESPASERILTPAG